MRLEIPLSPDARTQRFQIHAKMMQHKHGVVLPYSVKYCNIEWIFLGLNLTDSLFEKSFLVTTQFRHTKNKHHYPTFHMQMLQKASQCPGWVKQLKQGDMKYKWFKWLLKYDPAVFNRFSSSFLFRQALHLILLSFSQLRMCNKLVNVPKGY